ncbi:MAG: hypothetical protein ABIS86_20295 [Streptosporangiaceae bacterium]
MSGDRRLPISATLIRVNAMLEVHGTMPFPDGLRGIHAPSGEQIAGVAYYVVKLVLTYRGANGVLDSGPRLDLASHATDLAAVLPYLAGQDAAYVVVLLCLAELIANEPIGYP